MLYEEDIMEAKKKFGEHVSRTIAKSGLSFYQITKESGLTREQIKSVMEGKRDYTVRTLMKIYYFLGLDGDAPPEILAGTEKEQSFQDTIEQDDELFEVSDIIRQMRELTPD